MADKTWKALERRTARRNGGERISKHNLGGDTADAENDWALFECKHRKTLPKIITESFWVLKGRAALKKKVPVLVLHEKGQRGSFYVMQESDFLDWHGAEKGGPA
ncbi:MAG: hypothetical protein V2A78_09650 [bacterium]